MDTKKPQEGEPGVKYDEGKLEWQWAHIPEFEEIAQLTMHGAKKYLPRNWENGMSWGRVWSALMRHNIAWWKGEDIDPESGLSHMIHVAWWAMALRRYEKTHPELDDRPSYSTMRGTGNHAIFTSAEMEALSPSKLKEGTPEKVAADPRLSIYLSGHINIDLPATLEWRPYVEETLAPRTDVKCLNPMRGKQPVAGDTTYAIGDRTSSDTILRDFHDVVRRADVVLLNLSSYGSALPSVGTIYELAWAWEHKVPVVAFKGDESSEAYYDPTHQFLAETITHLSRNLNSALEHIITYYAA